MALPRVQGPLRFSLYISDIPLIIEYPNVNANPQRILFVDDTSIIVSNPNNSLLGNNLKSVFINVMKWFKANLLIKFGQNLTVQTSTLNT
jgi:hypothetical protein